MHSGKPRHYATRRARSLRFEYDPLGRITKRIAPEGNASWTWGNTAAKHDIGRLAAISGPGYAESFIYDAIGRPANHTIVSDASYRYDFTYNRRGCSTS